eukprot:1158274-Pelagomonas_calceolata.AAC.58
MHDQVHIPSSIMSTNTGSPPGIYTSILCLLHDSTCVPRGISSGQLITTVPSQVLIQLRSSLETVKDRKLHHRCPKQSVMRSGKPNIREHTTHAWLFGRSRKCT